MADRITELRKALKLTQGDLAKASGVTQGSISRWEDGKGEPSASELVGLSRALHVNIHFLVTGQGREELPGADDPRSYPTGVRDALARFRATADELEAATVGETPTLHTDELAAEVERIERAEVARKRRRKPGGA